jgi:hypothetical protein
MVDNNKLTLKSGKEITYRKPGWEERSEIQDMAIECHVKGMPISMRVCNKAALNCGVATTQELNDRIFTDTELVEIYNLLSNLFYDAELNKKK